jgi:hypothetical protein
MPRAARATLLVAWAAAGCSSGTTSDPGLDLGLRVHGAQLVRAALPTPGAGPKVTFVDVQAPRIMPGDANHPLSGRTEGSAYAVNIAIDRDQAYWIVPTGVQDTGFPGELTWEASLDFARSLAPGPFQVEVQATDKDGQPGPVSTAAFEALPLIPSGALVVTLEWDADVDADLLVQDPTGIILGGGRINTYMPPPPGTGLPPPGAWKDGGMLDVDSLANCVPDGRRRENAVWANPPPPGHYTVWAALARSCGLWGTHFVVTVRRNDNVVTTTEGALYASDALSYPDPTQPPKAPGVWAADFDVQ